MQPLTFNVPWEALCSDNRKYVRGYILSKRYRQSKHVIGELARLAAEQAGWTETRQRIGIVIVVRAPDRRHRDLNFSKSLKDGITASGGVWIDDKQVRDEHWIFDDLNVSPLIAGATITIRLLEPLRDVSQKPRPRLSHRHQGSRPARSGVRARDLGVPPQDQPHRRADDHPVRKRRTRS
jgi:Holliday junction resolvase RusA-like endonuclease